ncbi:MAG: heme exporter protein CcmD [Methyloceanibacter sp.]|nr:heme exporter protein CcmD [Methyloceanibacter sp.]
MLGLGPHASFIIGAYGAAFVTLGALVIAIVLDDRKQRRLLADLERRGITRRSSAKRRPAAAPTVTRTAP